MANTALRGRLGGKGAQGAVRLWDAGEHLLPDNLRPWLPPGPGDPAPPYTPQFGMPLDKRLPYEFDIRVPLWVSGPNITGNQSIDTPVLSIDIAPTLLALAGLPQDVTMDGEWWWVTILDLLVRFVPTSPGAAQHHRPHPRPSDGHTEQ